MSVDRRLVLASRLPGPAGAAAPGRARPRGRGQRRRRVDGAAPRGSPSRSRCWPRPRPTAVAKQRDRRAGHRRDSLLEFHGKPLGKPPTPHEARDRWQQMAGRSRHAAHRAGAVRRPGRRVVGRDVAVASTVVHFASPTPQELEAYLATGEPLAVAGAFTLDGLGAPFVRRVEGDPAAVVGLSLTRPAHPAGQARAGHHRPLAPLTLPGRHAGPRTTVRPIHSEGDRRCRRS